MCEKTESFIKRAVVIHGNLYSYEDAVYVNGRAKVKITCKKHGIFEQSAKNHLSGRGCLLCSREKRVDSDFINKAVAIHGDRYSYDEVVYLNNKNKVKIICKSHGVFEQRPDEHLSGGGCIACVHDELRFNNDLFVKKAMVMHNGKYDYSRVIYTSAHNKVNIICGLHGEFSQKASNHLRGDGCPKCRASKGETAVANALNGYGLLFKEQAKFIGCRSKNGIQLKFDFYIESLNLLIEFDGKQHFTKVDAFGGTEGFLSQKRNDEIKNHYCESRGMSLLRIKFNEDIEKAIDHMLEVIEENGYGCVFYGKEIIHEKWASLAA
ncbi:hypothetical protein [Serratia sp. Se-RSBMAAmG]|uniref:hypothetical protein n=1 Tax=Serratia sp. Se-RSBMAAmG TaxID=3043305 RepID=UPI0024AEA5AF|nr:hypothetical protein [Serratia sp. Se-RSBMAAmG]MDI6977290.1 hypothetical protein [Serratia sp. Se-RSBMAAmG]